MKVSNEKANEKVQEVIIEISKDDYAADVEMKLKKQRRVAQVPGFRVGNAPMGMIKRLYEKSMIAEAVNELASKNLYNYLDENKIEYMFEPMIIEEKSTVDFENAADFTFAFEFAVKPAFDLDMTAIPVVTDFHIKASEVEVNNFVDGLRRKYGEYTSPEEVGEEDNISVTYGEDKNGFILVSDLSDEGKKNIVGKKVNEVVNVTLKNAFNDEMHLRRFLHITEENFDKEADYNYDLTITHIGRLTLAEVNEDFLKKAFPDESIKTVEEFNNYAVAQVEEQWKRESDRKFSNDAITALIDNVSIELPDDFIRRYILRSNSEMTQEKLDAEYENYAKSFKWQLIENKLTQDSEIKVTMDEIKDYIRNFFIQNYFNQFNPVEIKDQLDKLVEQAVQKREDVKNIYDQLYDQKLVALLRDKMTTELKEGSLDDFIAFATGKPAETSIEEKKTSKAKASKAKKTVAEGETPAPKKTSAKKTTKKDKDE